MWPSASGTGGATNPIWGGIQPQNPNPQSGGSWFGPNSGGSGGNSNPTPGFPGSGGSNPTPGGWFGPNSGGSGGSANPTPGFPAPGGSNPTPGGWFGPNSGGSGGSANPTPGFPAPGGSNPTPGGWFGPSAGGSSNPTPGFPSPGGNPATGWPGSGGGSQPTTPSSTRSQVAPCCLNLPAGVYDKLLLTISGRIKAHAKKFTVDLSTRNDIAFHLNPRFDDCGDRNVVVRNSCQGKRWEREERQLSHFPFSPNRNFEMKILCTHNEYKVAVDGSHLLAFKHRITNLRDIQKVSIYYDVENITIKAETMP